MNKYNLLQEAFLKMPGASSPRPCGEGVAFTTQLATTHAYTHALWSVGEFVLYGAALVGPDRVDHCWDPSLLLREVNGLVPSAVRNGFVVEMTSELVFGKFPAVLLIGPAIHALVKVDAPSLHPLVVHAIPIHKVEASSALNLDEVNELYWGGTDWADTERNPQPMLRGRGYLDGAVRTRPFKVRRLLRAPVVSSYISGLQAVGSWAEFERWSGDVLRVEVDEPTTARCIISGSDGSVQFESRVDLKELSQTVQSFAHGRG